MGCLVSSAETPPPEFVGSWTLKGASHLVIGPDGHIIYKKPGLSIEGMGMTGWKEGKITGHICCISQTLRIKVVSEDELEVDGFIFTRMPGAGSYDERSPLKS